MTLLRLVRVRGLGKGYPLTPTINSRKQLGLIETRSEGVPSNKSKARLQKYHIRRLLHDASVAQKECGTTRSHSFRPRWRHCGKSSVSADTCERRRSLNWTELDWTWKSSVEREPNEGRKSHMTQGCDGTSNPHTSHPSSHLLLIQHYESANVHDYVHTGKCFLQQKKTDQIESMLIEFVQVTFWK